jgi:ribosomal protein S18 acetylase RimI-like enzyme
MSRATIRPARTDDVPAASRLAAALVRQHHAFDPDRFMLVEPVEEGYARFLRTQVDREGVVFLVAELDGAVAGYLLGGLAGRDWMLLLDDCGQIHDVFVDASARGRGIGAGLVEEAVSRLVAMGAPRVVLSTAWPNEPARRLFSKLGFRETMVEMTREADPSRNTR